MTATYSLTIRKLNQQKKSAGNGHLRRARGLSVQRRRLHRSSSKESSSSSIISDSSFKMNNSEAAERSLSLRSLRASQTCGHDMCQWSTQISPSAVRHDNSMCSHLAESRKQLVGHKLSSSQCQSCMSLLRNIGGGGHDCNHETIPENEELSDIAKPTVHRVSRSTNELVRGSSDGGRFRPRISKYLHSRANITDMISKWKSNRSIYYSQIDRERKATQVMPCTHMYIYTRTCKYYIPVSLHVPRCTKQLQEDRHPHLMSQLAESVDTSVAIIHGLRLSSADLMITYDS